MCSPLAKLSPIMNSSSSRYSEGTLSRWSHSFLFHQSVGMVSTPRNTSRAPVESRSWMWLSRSDSEKKVGPKPRLYQVFTRPSKALLNRSTSSRAHPSK